MAEVKAVSRVEAILNGEDITPVTRKEAILSGADVEPLSREEYFVQKRLAGGGSGLTYVIPEQTVTFNSSGTANVLGINVAGLESEDTVITKLVINNNAHYEIASYYDNTIEFSDENIGTINTNTGVWTSSTTNRSMNVSAIRRF